MTPSATVCSALGDCTTVGPFGPFAVNLVSARCLPCPPSPFVVPPAASAGRDCYPSTPAVGIYRAGERGRLRSGPESQRQVYAAPTQP